MKTDKLDRLARVHPAWPLGLTAVAVALVVAAGVTEDSKLIMLVGVAVPLALVAAIQSVAVGPLAAEVIRLREQLAGEREESV